MESSFAGVDWASEKHDVVVQNAAGEELLAASFAHDEAGLRSLCRQLVRLNVQLVAIERPDGVLVERLLDAGLRVLALHPNQVAAARARFRVSGGKSDRFDAFVLCELARTDHHRFRVLEPDSDQTKALRALCRGREDLVQARVALTNQLRAELERFWPGAVKIFRSIDSPIALAFLEKYPSPIEARTLGEQRLAAFLRRQQYSGGKTPRELLRKLRSAPEGRAGETEIRTRRQLVLASSGCCDRWSPRSRSSSANSRERLMSTPTGNCSGRCSATPNRSSPPPSWSPKSEIAEGGTPPAMRSPATPAKPRWRSSPANARSPATAGRATSGYATRSARSPTRPATDTPGRRTTTPVRSPADTTTPARSAASAEPGAASSGAVGKTAPHTTPPATALCNSMSR